MTAITARTAVAGVVGAPISHSLSPRLHNAWLEAAGIDAVYLGFAGHPDRFEGLVEGLRSGAVLGLNVTIPFKERALLLADNADAAAAAAGAANLLLFSPEGWIEARNTDGAGLIGALRAQAPDLDLRVGPAVIFGAGGAARGAAAALLQAGAPQVRIVNRTLARAEALAEAFGAQAAAYADDQAEAAAAGAAVLINATSLGLGGGPGPSAPWDGLAPGTVVMDMVYRPLHTDFLLQAQARGLTVVDGLEMLIRQAIPSFEALFGRPPPRSVDARGLLLAALEAEAPA
jgi:shikimate dehydrogenase